MSWMKDVSLKNVNNVNIIVIKACVDLIIVDISYWMLVHGIDENRSIPSWMYSKADACLDMLLDFWNQYF